MVHWNEHGIIVNGDDKVHKTILPRKTTVNKAVIKCLKKFNTIKLDFQTQVDYILQTILTLTKSQGGYISKPVYNNTELTHLLCHSIAFNDKYGFSRDDIQNKQFPKGATFPMQNHLLHSRAVAHGYTIVSNYPNIFEYHKCPGIKIRNIYYYCIRDHNDQITNLICLVNSKRNYSVKLSERLQPLYNLFAIIYNKKVVQQDFTVTTKKNMDLSCYFIRESDEIIAILDQNYIIKECSNSFAETMQRICDCSEIPESFVELVKDTSSLEPLLEAVISKKSDYRMYSIHTGVIEEHFELKTGVLEDTGDIFIFGRNISKDKQMYLDLQKAKDAVDAALQGKDMYLSRVSHELKTPLNAINGFAQLLCAEMNSGKKPSAKYIHNIITCCKNLGTLISDVIAISTMGTGKLHLSLEPVDCNSTINEIVATVGPLTRRLEVTINTNYNNHWYIINADAAKFKSVITNIVTNAIKYNKQYGKIDICISSDAPFVIITIQDTGIGISRTQMKEIYTPFNRCGMDMSEIEGTGMGLTLAKCYTEAMNGTIDIQSDPGIGTKVTLRFPLHSVQEAHPVNNEKELLTCAEKTILYIEDNKLNYDVMADMITFFNQDSDYQYILHRAKTGQEGLKMVHEHKYACIILDLGLTDMHGKECFKLLKTNPETINIPVIVYTASLDNSMKAELEKYGQLHKYLNKPCDMKVIKDCINAAVNSTAAPRTDGLKQSVRSTYS